jgi:hypothetical protein
MSHATPDPLSADPDAIPRSGPGPLRVADCARAFVRYASPKLIAAALLLALAARIVAGHWSWRDVVIPAGLVALEPFTEWVIHVYLLHAKPLRIGGRRYDLLAAREHREHHLAPAELDGVLIPTYAVLIFLPLIALTVFGLSFPAHALLGGDRVAGVAIGVLSSYAILGTYEWCHFLIHTPYRPKSRYYKAIWRNHRLHHYKNEHYWFGITSNFGDIVIGTNPDQASVAKSATARTLGAAD